MRTESRGHWAAAIAAALRFDNDILEVYATNWVVRVNGTTVNLPTSLDGIYPLTVTSNTVTVTLPSAQSITFISSYGSGITIRVDGHGSYFYDSLGMCGKWSEFGLIGRDGVTAFTDPYVFAKDWEVDASLGDPILFSTPPSNIVDVTPPTPPQFTDDEIQDATEVCDQLTFVDDISEANCIFDALLTDEDEVLDNPSYVDPFVPTERCIAAGVNGTSCADLGGECVYECDSANFNCVQTGNLCSLNPDLDFSVGSTTKSRRLESVEGCSCALPITSAPTVSSSPSVSPIPTGSPTESPTRTPTVPPGVCNRQSNCICEEYPGKMIGFPQYDIQR